MLGCFGKVGLDRAAVGIIKQEQDSGCTNAKGR